VRENIKGRGKKLFYCSLERSSGRNDSLIFFAVIFPKATDCLQQFLLPKEMKFFIETC